MRRQEDGPFWIIQSSHLLCWLRELFHFRNLKSVTRSSSFFFSSLRTLSFEKWFRLLRQPEMDGDLFAFYGSDSLGSIYFMQFFIFICIVFNFRSGSCCVIPGVRSIFIFTSGFASRRRRNNNVATLDHILCLHMKLFFCDSAESC